MKLKHLLLASVLLTACSCSKSDGGEENPGGGGGGDIPAWGQQPELPVVNGTSTVNLDGGQFAANVMGEGRARMPAFPTLTVKKGFARGFVADMSGKPLKGAYIGVRATYTGGSYTGASAETNEKGYYEIKLPSGANHFYAAGYTIDYSGSRAVVSLLPAMEGNATFPSADGIIKNFVMASYGVGNRDEVVQQPGNAFNYFGGAITFSYNINYENDPLPMPNYLPENGEIEIKLTPDGPGLFGETRSFIINKKIGVAQFAIVNIPVGKYIIAAKLKTGQPLRMTEVGPYAGSYAQWGLNPRTAAGSAKLSFITGWQIDPVKTTFYHGNWQALNLKLER